MLTFANTLSTSNIGLMGLRVYFRLRDVLGPLIIDLGNIENLTPNRESTETNIQSARNGPRSTVKVLQTAVADTYTFESLDVADPTIVSLHEGSDAIPVIAGAGAGNHIIIRKPGASLIGELMVLEPGAANTDSKVLYIPKAQLRGNGFTASNGTDPGRLAFSVALLTDEGYSVPATVLAAATPAPNGVVALLEVAADPIAGIHTLLEKLIQPMDAQGGV